MTREKKKSVKSFSIGDEALGKLRAVAEESGIVGGMSVIVNDAVTLWLRRYEIDGIEWLRRRGMPVQGTPKDDDL
jgi:hypothetical protein